MHGWIRGSPDVNFAAYDWADGRRRTLYLLNRDHVAAEAIVALTRLRTPIIERITDALSHWSPEPVHASLFGSFARGEATATSDIDILVVIGPDGAIGPDGSFAGPLDVGDRGVRVCAQPEIAVLR